MRTRIVPENPDQEAHLQLNDILEALDQFKKEGGDIFWRNTDRQLADC